MKSARTAPTTIDVRPRSVRRGAILLTALALTMAFTSMAIVAPSASALPPVDDPSERVITPEVKARATLSADYLAPGPRSGALATPANGRTGPFDGQVIPGFSAAVANDDGTFWAMPDNGFGTKANSEDFLLRIYLVRPRWERTTGGSGDIQILRYLTLSDPHDQIDFPIVNQDTRRRLLTGGDFDIESLQKGENGSFWIGDEFGPFLLHVDRRGTIMEPPIPFPLGRSPQNPDIGDEPPKTQPSGGFEAMARSTNGRYLYPILEKVINGDTDPRRRVISQYDTARGRYTGRTWTYRTDTDANLVADAQILRGKRMLVLERDDFDGEAAVTKRIYEVNLNRTEPGGQLTKSLVVDLLKLNNPADLGAGDGWGTGASFSFGFQSVETLVVLPGGRFMIANDNNYPSNAARRPGTPDDTEMIIIDPRALAPVPVHLGTVVGHRGASGYRPEHTLAAYALAIRQCADVIEPDVVITADGIPVARHENDISGTSDVASRTEFANRRKTKIIDGARDTGWFAEDFTLAELRTLRAKERLPGVRPGNTAFDGKYPIPTLAEVLDLARHSRSCAGKPIGVAPETKHSTYFAGIGLPLEPPLLSALREAGLDTEDSAVLIQSFEVGNLQRLSTQTAVRLVQLIDCSGRPYDLQLAGDPRRYADLATRQGLAEIATYADAVGFCKNVMIPRDRNANLLAPSAAISDAHDAGLEAIGWTFRRENQYLPLDFRIGTDPNAPGNLAGEITRFLAAGMDGYFTDNPDIGSSVVLT